MVTAAVDEARQRARKRRDREALAAACSMLDQVVGGRGGSAVGLQRGADSVDAFDLVGPRRSVRTNFKVSPYAIFGRIRRATQHRVRGRRRRDARHVPTSTLFLEGSHITFTLV